MRPRPLRALERMLGVDGPQRAKHFWAIPALVLVGTVLAFFTIGEITAAPLYVSLPNGIVIAFVMAGLAVACMSPVGGNSPPDDPPADDDETPVLGSPGGPWTVVAHLGSGSTAGRDQTGEPVAGLSRSAAAGRR